MRKAANRANAYIVGFTIQIKVMCAREVLRKESMRLFQSTTFVNLKSG